MLCSLLKMMKMNFKVPEYGVKFVPFLYVYVVNNWIAVRKLRVKLLFNFI